MITETTALIELATLVSEALERAGIVATLSGGAAVSIYSENRYLSEDLDFVTVAVVAVARDGVPEAGAGTARKRMLTDGAGNYVVLRLDDQHHVFYEHLAPGSIRVAVGDRVQKGQVIAALGSTGDSRRAHLHFHVADSDSTLGAEGLPFVLEAFSLLGAYADIEVLGRQPWTPRNKTGGDARRSRELPAPNVVLMFDKSW
jgi:murein DD-endopeptidase